MTPRKVIVVGPRGRTLNPYLATLVEALNREGWSTSQIGSHGVPYDAETGRFLEQAEAMSIARRLARQVDSADAAVVVFHIGRLEVEQYVPLFCETRAVRVLHAHNLSWDLPHLAPGSITEAALIARYRTFFDHLFCFTSFARARLMSRLGFTASDVSVIHQPATVPAALPETNACRDYWPPGNGAMISVLGYASPWKPLKKLLASAAALTTSIRILIAGAFWTVDAPDEVPCHVRIVDRFFHVAEFGSLIRQSDFGLLPYVDRSGTFQGSGMLSNYLFLGVPAFVYDHPALTELMPSPFWVVPSVGGLECMDERIRFLTGHLGEYRALLADWQAHSL